MHFINYLDFLCHKNTCGRNSCNMGKNPSLLHCFSGGSAGKESACNPGDPSSIPGLGRSAGEGIGYPLQYSCPSLVTHLVKNQPAMQETWVRSLVWEDPLEKGKATHSSILAWRLPWTVESMGSQRVGHDQVTLTSLRSGGCRTHREAAIGTGLARALGSVQKPLENPNLCQQTW